jgi:DNA mismatch endonuclease (patch repair protein)
MMDVHTPEQRSRNMAAIKYKNTKPEMVVRRLLHSMGYRFRLHRSDLPGKPDIVLPKYHKVIFVHGCFWHMHDCEFGRVVPKTNAEFWQAKRQGNTARDEQKANELQRSGWEFLVVWECELKDLAGLKKKMAIFCKKKPRVSAA